MVFPCARAPALGLALLAAVLAGGCKADDEVVPDGGGEADAAVDSGTADGGEDLCPGQLTFEALVADAESGDAVFEVDVAEVGASNNSTVSAPNGRAVLCLPSAGESVVRSTKDSYLTRVDTVSADAVEPTLGTAQPYPIDVLSESAADELITVDLGLPFDNLATQLLVSVVSYPDSQPLVGATILIDQASNGAFARDGQDFVGGDEIGEVGAGRLVLFANTALGGGDQPGRATVTVTPPDGFDGACPGSLSVELLAGGLSGAFFACQ